MIRLLGLALSWLLVVACAGDGARFDSTESSRRILSLSPHSTQMLEAFGVMDEVVGVTDFCPLPDSHPGIPRVGGLMNPNVEMMLSLRPGMVVYAPTARSVEDRLAAAGARLVPLPNESLEDIFGGINRLGEELGVSSRASEIIEGARESLIKLEMDLGGSTRPSVLFVIGHSPGTLRDIHAAGPDTFLEELIGIAGGKNHLANAPTRYPQVSRESLIRDPPDVILMAAPVGGWTTEEKDFLRDSWRQLLGPSGGAARVEFLDDMSMTIPGPFVHRSARRLAHLIHLTDVEN